jgi:hypothetical protein
MSKELVPLKIHFLSASNDYKSLPLPKCTIKFDDVVLAEDIGIDSTVKEYQISIDDDIENEHKLEIFYNTKNVDIFDILPEDSNNPNGKIEYGVFINNIELNEILLDTGSVILGNISAIICEKSEYDTDGFIHYLKENNSTDQIRIEDDKCIWETPGNFLNLENSKYTFTFRTPMYIWLLESLLQ